MKKIALFIGLFIVLFACTLTKEIPENDLSIEEYGGSAIDSTALYDEDLDYGDFEFDEEPKVRGIYNSSRTLYTDLIHTKLEVNFNWVKSQLNAVATITAKPHFHSSDSIVLDAKGMDIKKVEMNGKSLNYIYKDSLTLHINLDRSY